MDFFAILGWLFGSGCFTAFVKFYRDFTHSRQELRHQAARAALEREMAQANIKRIEAELNLTLEQTRASLFNDLQEERQECRKQLAELKAEIQLERDSNRKRQVATQEQLAVQSSRIQMLEGILKANNIQIPA